MQVEVIKPPYVDTYTQTHSPPQELKWLPRPKFTWNSRVPLGSERRDERHGCKCAQLEELSKESVRGGRRPLWLHQDLLATLKHKTKMHMQWREGYMSSEDYRDMAWECRERIRKGKELELNLARDVKNNMESSGTWDNKGRWKKLRPPASLVSEMGDLATTGMEKAEVLTSVFPWSSRANTLAMPPSSQRLKARAGRM